MLLDTTSTKSAAASIARGPTSLAPSAPARRFYLVGEAERSNRRPTTLTDGRTSISINGSWHALRGKSATFEQLLRIAFPDRTLLSPEAATVTYRHGAKSAPEGMLTPGDVIPLSEGLLVNANVTYAS